MSLEQRRNKARSTREQTRWNSARRRSDPYYPSWSRRESHRRRRDQGCCAALRMPTTASLNMPMRIPADRTPESRVRRHGVAVRRHSAAWRHADGPSGRPSRLPTLVATKNGHGRALTDPVDHGDGDGTSSPPRVSAQITDPGLLDCRRSGAPPPAPPRRGLQGLNGPGGAHPGSAGDPDRGPPPQTVRRGCAPTSPTLLQTQPTPPTVRSPDRPPHTRTPNPEPRHGARLAALGRDATPGPAPGTRVIHPRIQQEGPKIGPHWERAARAIMPLTWTFSATGLSWAAADVAAGLAATLRRRRAARARKQVRDGW